MYNSISNGLVKKENINFFDRIPRNIFIQLLPCNNLFLYHVVCSYMN